MLSLPAMCSFLTGEPEVWRLFGDQYYGLIELDTEGRSWAEAADWCKQQGASLIALRTQEENDCMTTLVSTVLQVYV